MRVNVGKRAAHDITPQIRGAWVRAAKIQKQRGKSLSELIADAMEKDVVSALGAIAKFLPRESKVDLSGSNLTLVAVLSSIAEDHSKAIEGSHTFTGEPVENAEPSPIASTIDNVLDGNTGDKP